MTREEAAQALYAVKDELMERHFEFKGHVSAPITAIDMAIEELQTEVVRCKDCKHKVVTEDGEYDPEDIVCEYWMSDGLNSNDYCSYGERKE